MSLDLLVERISSKASNLSTELGSKIASYMNPDLSGFLSRASEISDKSAKYLASLAHNPCGAMKSAKQWYERQRAFRQLARLIKNGYVESLGYNPLSKAGAILGLLGSALSPAIITTA